jgi:hypothetical protein
MGWSLAVTCEGGRIQAVSGEGLSVTVIGFKDGLPDKPYERCLEWGVGHRADFVVFQTGVHPATGRTGAMSAANIQDLDFYMEDILDPAQVATIARITVAVDIPLQGEAPPVNLRFEDGVQGLGQPVKNVVAMHHPEHQFLTLSQAPALGTCVIPVRVGTFFLRGDANVDGTTDISDAIVVLGFLFLGAGEVPCEQASDSNDDGTVDLSDAVFLLSHLFLGGTAPSEPFGTCGTDPTPDRLTCESFERCP